MNVRRANAVDQAVAVAPEEYKRLMGLPRFHSPAPAVAACPACYPPTLATG